LKFEEIDDSSMMEHFENCVVESEIPWNINNISSNWKNLKEKISTSNHKKKRKLTTEITKTDCSETTVEKNAKKTRKQERSNNMITSLLPKTSFEKRKSGEITKILALDCEMVGVEGGKSMLARVVIINSFGDVLYDKYVQPQEKVIDYRTHVSGIEKRHLKQNIAYPFKEVQQEVTELIEGRIVVGHALENDFRALLISHPFLLTRDTAKFRPLQRSKGRPRALKYLARRYLGVTIQTGEHDPAEDARSALLLYKNFKKQWENLLVKKGKRISRKRQTTNAKKTSDTFSLESISESDSHNVRVYGSALELNK